MQTPGIVYFNRHWVKQSAMHENANEFNKMRMNDIWNTCSGKNDFYSILIALCIQRSLIFSLLHWRPAFNAIHQMHLIHPHDGSPIILIDLTAHAHFVHAPLRFQFIIFCHSIQMKPEKNNRAHCVRLCLLPVILFNPIRRSSTMNRWSLHITHTHTTHWPQCDGSCFANILKFKNSIQFTIYIFSLIFCFPAFHVIDTHTHTHNHSEVL